MDLLLVLARGGTFAVAGLCFGCGARTALEESVQSSETLPIVGISGHLYTTCALRSEGAVVCWGAPFGKAEVTPFADAVEISVGGMQACTRTAEGHVACLSVAFTTYEFDGGASPWPAEPVVVPGISDATQISVGASHACALRAGGVLVCWGDNGFGQLGDGTFADAEIPVAVGLGPVLAVSAGESATCALTEAGVHCWGRALDGQLGDGGGPREACGVEETCSPSPVRVQGLSSPRRVSAGVNGACALDGDSRVRCWGWHSGTDGHGTSPVAIEIPGMLEATDVYAGSTHACTIRPGSRARCWGDNSSAALGGGDAYPYNTSPVDVVNLDGVTRVAGGKFHTCALRSDGVVFCWGSNAGLNQLGDDTFSHRTSPGPVPLP